MLGFLSDGVHHDDDLTHFLMARWSVTFPEYLLNFWARPGFTLPMSTIAWIGSPQTAWHVCRIASSLVTLAATLLAIRVAGRLGVRPLWAVALACVLQPISTLLAYTTLVENFASLYVIAGVALLLSSRLTLASAVFSMAFVTRYDTLIFLPIWWLALWFARPAATRRPAGSPPRLAACAVALWAPALHQLLLMVVLGAKPWLAFASPSGSTDYTPAGPLVYVPQLLLAVPPVILALAMVGGVRMAANGKWLVPALAGAFITAHVILRARGMYASGGFARFIVTVGPLVAICAAAGLTQHATVGFSTDRRRGTWFACALVLVIGVLALRSEARAGRVPLTDWRPYIAAITVALSLAGLCVALTLWPPSRIRRRVAALTATLLALTIAVQFLAVVRPLHIPLAARSLRNILTLLDQHGFGDRPLFSASPWPAYFRDFAEMPQIRKSRRLLASMPAGTVLIWDAIYCPSDYHRLPLDILVADTAYRRLDLPIPGFSVLRKRDFPDYVVMEKLAATPVPEIEPPAYPPEIVAPAEPRGRYYIERSASRHPSRMP